MLDFGSCPVRFDRTFDRKEPKEPEFVDSGVYKAVCVENAKLKKDVESLRLQLDAFLLAARGPDSHSTPVQSIPRAMSPQLPEQLLEGSVQSIQPRTLSPQVPEGVQPYTPGRWMLMGRLAPVVDRVKILGLVVSSLQSHRLRRVLAFLNIALLAPFTFCLCAFASRLHFTTSPLRRDALKYRREMGEIARSLGLVRPRLACWVDKPGNMEDGPWTTHSGSSFDDHIETAEKS